MSDKKKRGLAVPNPDRRQCSAHSSRSGERCKKPPIRGGTVCATHGGRAPNVRRKAQERLLEAADSLMAALLKIASSAESEAVRLAAIRDALDRAGFQPAQLIKFGIGQEDPWGDLLADIINDEDVFERVDRRAITASPARSRGGGGGDDEPEEDTGPVVQVVEYDPDDDVSSDDLSWNTPGTIRGEVVLSPRKVEPHVPERLRAGLGVPSDEGGAAWTR